MNTSATRPSVQSLAAEPFDVVVVGAGIHGAAAAWTAARLGLRTALLDMGDFGAATSASSLKVLHGGLRYLQHGNFSRMRESIRARRRFFQLAPHLCRPQAFLMPTRGAGVRSRAALAVALKINDMVAADRNEGVPEARWLPAGRMLSAAETRQILAGLPESGITGAGVWYDGLGDNTERLTLSFVLSAENAGACVANYVQATRLITEQGAVTGVEVTDRLEGGTFPVRGRVVINASGPWLEQAWQGGAAGREKFPLVGAWNVIVPRRWFGGYGVALESTQAHRDADALIQRGKRNLFFVPWRSGTIIGTVYVPFEGDPANYQPSAASVRAFLEEVNTVYPPARLTAADISLLHVGVQPGPPERGAGSVEPDKHSEVIDHAARGGPRGLISIKGVKYTTGLEVGERAGRLAAHQMAARNPEKNTPFYGQSKWMEAQDVMQAAHRLRLSLPAAAAARLAAQYGGAMSAVLEEAGLDSAALLPGAPDVLRAEIRHAVRCEHAVKLADVMMRRTELGTFGRPSEPVLGAVADEMAELLSWSPERRAAELDAVRARYPDFTTAG